jgi:hypothetical protein
VEILVDLFHTRPDAGGAASVGREADSGRVVERREERRVGSRRTMKGVTVMTGFPQDLQVQRRVNAQVDARSSTPFNRAAGPGGKS